PGSLPPPARPRGSVARFPWLASLGEGDDLVIAAVRERLAAFDDDGIGEIAIVRSAGAQSVLEGLVLQDLLVMFAEISVIGGLTEQFVVSIAGGAEAAAEYDLLLAAELGGCHLRRHRVRGVHDPVTEIREQRIGLMPAGFAFQRRIEGTDRLRQIDKAATM